MRKAVFFFLVVLGISLAGSTHLNAQNTNSITGFVFGEDRRPIPQMWVELLNENMSTLIRKRTTGSGNYSFYGLSAGIYTVKVMVMGTNYQEQTQRVAFSDMPGMRTGGEQVDFYLRARAAPKPKKAPAVVFAQEVPAAAKALYDAGVDDLSKNNEQGLIKIKQAIEAFPDYYYALDRLGTEYVMRGHYEAAYVLLAKAFALNSKSFTSAFGRGLAEYRLGRSDQALISFDKAVELDNGSANAHLWRGIALHSKKDLPGALKAMLKANELANGTSAEVHWQLARVYKDDKKYTKAADELELYLTYKPEAENMPDIKLVIASLRQKKA